MRTTLTLDPDVAHQIGRRVAEGNATQKQVVNEALRRGLAVKPAGKPGKRFRVVPHSFGFRPGVDVHKLVGGGLERRPSGRPGVGRHLGLHPDRHAPRRVEQAVAGGRRRRPGPLLVGAAGGQSGCSGGSPPLMRTWLRWRSRRRG